MDEIEVLRMMLPVIVKRNFHTERLEGTREIVDDARATSVGRTQVGVGLEEDLHLRAPVTPARTSRRRLNCFCGSQSVRARRGPSRPSCCLKGASRIMVARVSESSSTLPGVTRRP